MTQRRLRVLVGKVGLDGHDRGAKVIARALRDSGFEVIYSGLHQTPAMLAATAVQEDVDCVGVSILSGAHNDLLPAVVKELGSRDAGDIFVFAGGVIPAEDIPALESAGVRAVFTPGTATSQVVEYLETEAQKRHEVSS